MAKAEEREDPQARRERWGMVIYWLCVVGAAVSFIFTAMVPLIAFSQEGQGTFNFNAVIFWLAASLGLWVLGWIVRFWLIERHKMPK